MNYFKGISINAIFLCGFLGSRAQENLVVDLAAVKGENKILVSVQGKPFTHFIYPDSLEKPILFPIYAPDGQPITRGFPIEPRADDPTDHPHHKGLWFDYENVNGLDFWNNSYAIPLDKKKGYGWIRTEGIISMKGGQRAELVYSALWKNQEGKALIRETTTFIFSAKPGLWIIERNSRLEALEDIAFTDAKDGLLGLRVAHALELPSAQPATYTDAKGNQVTIAANSKKVTGNYLTSEGKTGDSAWGTRAVWCMMYGKMGEDTISISIIDHPGNPGYPTYWHARGYGLFAANPLGQKIFSQGKQELNFKLKKGESTSFRYQILISSGKNKPSVDTINQMARRFGEN